ncbi:hypothetical protein GCM10010497_53560 [Streptomyces cinereoruber]|uniref:Uncharacterized protein n=1 Tax=Streptomyces cinereoruber TaxID=67260 RepID=A0AAV4KQ31_9ACTN|nr:hypothetical protein GCM10010497_53560 [Streptomyces cinereoruber]
MTRVTVAVRAPVRAEASLPIKGRLPAVPSRGSFATDGATAVAARTAAVAAPRAVREIGRIALPI